jgi:hypothetical protein
VATTEEKTDEGDGELDIKEQVRKRDGYKCRDCGMTSEESLEVYGKELDVHRLIPGSSYGPPWCVTLCRKCHAKKPKKTAEAIWCKDLRCFFFNMYEHEDAKLYEALRNHAVGRDMSPGDVILEAIRKYFEKQLEHDWLDLTMQADGL